MFGIDVREDGSGLWRSLLGRRVDREMEWNECFDGGWKNAKAGL